MPNLLKITASPAITLGLSLSLSAWYLLLVAAGSVAPGWQALDLLSFRLWSALLFLNLIAGSADALLRRGKLRFCFCLAALFLLASAAYCYLFRFDGMLSLAEGESYEPFPSSFNSGQKGVLAPFPQLAFTLTRVNPDNKMGRVVIVQRGAGSEVGGDWFKIGDSEIRNTGSGLAPLVVVSGKDQGELERSYVKLDLAGGKEESFMFDTLPYEFYLRKEKPKGGSQERFHLEVRRGKLSLFDGAVTAGEQVPVQAVRIAILDERKFAKLEIRTRRGYGLLLAAAGLLALVSLAGIVAKIKGRAPESG